MKVHAQFHSTKGCFVDVLGDASINNGGRFVIKYLSLEQIEVDRVQCCGFEQSFSPVRLAVNDSIQVTFDFPFPNTKEVPEWIQRRRKPLPEWVFIYARRFGSFPSQKVYRRLKKGLDSDAPVN